MGYPHILPRFGESSEDCQSSELLRIDPARTIRSPRGLSTDGPYVLLGMQIGLAGLAMQHLLDAHATKAVFWQLAFLEQLHCFRTELILRIMVAKGKLIIIPLSLFSLHMMVLWIERVFWQVFIGRRVYVSACSRKPVVDV